MKITTTIQMSLSLFLKSFFKILIKQIIVGRINANKVIIPQTINPIPGVTNSMFVYLLLSSSIFVIPANCTIFVVGVCYCYFYSQYVLAGELLPV